MVESLKDISDGDTFQIDPIIPRDLESPWTGVKDIHFRLSAAHSQGRGGKLEYLPGFPGIDSKCPASINHRLTQAESHIHNPV